MARVDEEEVARARVDAGRHAQLHLACRAHRRAHVLDAPLHVGRGAGRAQLVPVAREEDEQRVAPEFEHVAGEAPGDADQCLEDAAEEQHELLGARASLCLEPLGERGEARDVDRDERAVEYLRRAARGVPAPLDDEPRQVRHECTA